MADHTCTRVVALLFVCSVRLHVGVASAVCTHGTCQGMSGPAVGIAANAFLQTTADERRSSAAASLAERRSSAAASLAASDMILNFDSSTGTSISMTFVIVLAAAILVALIAALAFLPKMRMPLLRVVTAEALPFYIFYLGFLDALTGLWIFLYTWSLPKDSYSYKAAGGLPGELNFCITNDMWSAIFSFSHEFKGQCVVMHNNHAGYINGVCMFFILCAIAYQAYVVLVRANSQVYHGSYLRATLDAGKGKVYKILAVCMALFLVVAFLDGFYQHGFLTLDDHFHRQLMKDFVEYKINDAVIVIVNALFLASEVETHIKYDDEEFGDIKFKRSLMQTVCMPSSDFMHQLQSSVLQAHAGHPDKLKAMLEKDEDMEKVLRICTIHKFDE